MIESTEIKKVDTISQIEAFEDKTYHFLGSRTERVIFLILITLISAGPIIFGKSIPSHADWHIHIEHAYNFKRCFWQGQFLPRWIDSQVNGYGEPIFNYYAPFIYYLFTFLEVIFRNPIISIKWTFVIPMILCTVFGYMYLRKHSSPLASTVAMVFIVFSPAIHIFIYNTNWPTSTIALAFLFLTLYGIDSFNKEVDFDFRSLLITSIGYAGMALSHLATAFIFTLLAIPYFLLNLNIHRTKKFLKNYVLSLVLGACLSGFYLFPACLEKNLVHADEVLTQGPLWDFSKNFLFTYLDRSIQEGYAWGIFDHRYYEVSNALFSLAVLLCIIPLILNYDKVKIYFSCPFRVGMAIFLFMFCFLMMTPISFFIWIAVKPMQTLQFPWRFTSLMLPFGALIIAYTVDFVRNLVKEKAYAGGYKIVFYLLALVFSLLVYVDAINMYKWKWVPEQSLLKAAINVLWGNEEYRPNLINDPNWKQKNHKQDFTPVIDSTSDLIDVTLVKWLSHERIFEIFSPEEHTLRLRTFYFPGWTAYVDGKKEEIKIDQKIGSMLLSIPPGKHEITIKFEMIPLRKWSAYISLGAVALYLYILFKILREKNFSMDNFAKLRDSKIQEVQSA